MFMSRSYTGICTHCSTHFESSSLDLALCESAGSEPPPPAWVPECPAVADRSMSVVDFEPLPDPAAACSWSTWALVARAKPESSASDAPGLIVATGLPESGGESDGCRYSITTKLESLSSATAVGWPTGSRICLKETEVQSQNNYQYSTMYAYFISSTAVLYCLSLRIKLLCNN